MRRYFNTQTAILIDVDSLAKTIKRVIANRQSSSVYLPHMTISSIISMLVIRSLYPKEFKALYGVYFEGSNIDLSTNRKGSHNTSIITVTSKRQKSPHISRLEDLIQPINGRKTWGFMLQAEDNLWQNSNVAVTANESFYRLGQETEQRISIDHHRIFLAQVLKNKPCSDQQKKLIDLIQTNFLRKVGHPAKWKNVPFFSDCIDYANCCTEPCFIVIVDSELFVC